jgi:hypothetical protein
MPGRAIPISFQLVREQETHHEKWSNEPIYHNTEPDLNPNGSLTEGEMERFVFDFAKDWVHHDKESDGCTRSADVEHSWERCIPIGAETLTNLPFCNAGPTLSTKFPSKMPMIMASKIHKTRSRSNHPRLL